MTHYEELLEKYGICKDLSGINEDGETTLITIDEDDATVTTVQRNNFIRITVYHKDGMIDEIFTR